MNTKDVQAGAPCKCLSPIGAVAVLFMALLNDAMLLTVVGKGKNTQE